MPSAPYKYPHFFNIKLHPSHSDEFHASLELMQHEDYDRGASIIAEGVDTRTIKQLRDFGKLNGFKLTFNDKESGSLVLELWDISRKYKQGIPYGKGMKECAKELRAIFGKSLPALDKPKQKGTYVEPHSFNIKMHASHIVDAQASLDLMQNPEEEKGASIVADYVDARTIKQLRDFAKLNGFKVTFNDKGTGSIVLELWNITRKYKQGTAYAKGMKECAKELRAIFGKRLA